MTLAILIPAAGFGRRMAGADKLLQPIDGTPILRIVAERALQVAAFVIVSVPDTDHPRALACRDLPVRLVPVPDRDDGMAASLRRGVGVLPPACTGLMILPADMPDLSAADLARIAKAFADAPAQICQATANDGTPGHPVVFPADCFDAIAQLQGDMGARSVLKANANRVQRIALPGQHALTDLDTPEAWAAWRADQEALRSP
ncbi:nucleotidyltransferase family protein [Pseudoprimorskyibacter insulae]|uniref:Purine catabolism protein PucB n=1 Tax=Pseudoprimorskyibacter insulae TaxID=1695997 RepID=A0A2R8AWI3_9RHOB|nr:nucleotidyltransferase family protein [Pseudoprimorskyibacter insulae]SPF80390.1 Purine catabolism protein PucB [Pseudoprimorskyibacter insulae]